MRVEKNIFKNGSTTYYWSSKFFPKDVRDDVFKLYSFVRVVDDIVDSVNPDLKRFESISKRWRSIKKQLDKSEMPRIEIISIDDKILENISFIVYRYNCETSWVDAFLASMEMDIKARKYKTLDDTLEYIYGSAEVIGLFMARIMRLPLAPYEAAKFQGRAMQFINFLRDIEEDNHLGRCYFPDKTLKEFGLKDLSQKTALQMPENFRKFIESQIDHYSQWQSEAQKGFEYIPKRLRIPLLTAVDMYNWTAQEISKNPMIVYEKKVKPTKHQVISRAAVNAIVN